MAQVLALRLGWDWVDADVELELRAGKSIAAIFAEDGEAAFRDLESAMLAELVRQERRVLATGGGVVLRAENRELLRSGANSVLKKGTGTERQPETSDKTQNALGASPLFQRPAKVVWLKATPETILRRLSEDWTTISRRPNLTTGGLDEIRDMLDKRTPLYRQCADLEIDTDDKTILEVAAEIIASL